MNSQWEAFFENEKSIEEKIKEAVSEIEKKPSKLCWLYWFFFIQFCLSVFLLIMSVLIPIWIIYG